MVLLARLLLSGLSLITLYHGIEAQFGEYDIVDVQLILGGGGGGGGVLTPMIRCATVDLVKLATALFYNCYYWLTTTEQEQDFRGVPYSSSVEWLTCRPCCKFY